MLGGFLRHERQDFLRFLPSDSLGMTKRKPTMVEKVAVAAGITPDQARLAIAAMRDPTKPMLSAACAAMSPSKRPTQKRVGSKAKHGIRYRAMIEKAMEEKESN